MNKYLLKFIKNNFKKPGKALDLGAGDFVDVEGLKDMGWNCEGVDIKTGTDLGKPFLSKNSPFDLVFSNYVVHKIKNTDVFIDTIYNNLKPDGWFLVHTFDKEDKLSKSELTGEKLEKLLKEKGFRNIKYKVLDFYDNDPCHKHYHKILEITGQK